MGYIIESQFKFRQEEKPISIVVTDTYYLSGDIGEYAAGGVRIKLTLFRDRAIVFTSKALAKEYLKKIPAGKRKKFKVIELERSWLK